MTEERLKEIEYALNQSRVIEGDDLSSEMEELIAEVRTLGNRLEGSQRAHIAEVKMLQAENARLREVLEKLVKLSMCSPLTIFVECPTR